MLQNPRLLCNYYLNTICQNCKRCTKSKECTQHTECWQPTICMCKHFSNFPWAVSNHNTQLTLWTCDWVAMCKLSRCATGNKKAWAELMRRPRLDIARTCISPGHNVDIHLPWNTTVSTINTRNDGHIEIWWSPGGNVEIVSTLAIVVAGHSIERC